eukprot:CAMPEP_0171323322 /NCGR_PEP_ID=MMETSP0816-20121228/115501_1 /TAXON_ID=420281 /ORGANISM="Proboscia inermis, Strain CCAP1064/1" /LENGTH=85 /DNA_ID=CAMNT_0011822001 /DNA_START=975 /DNA_END=1232 /DNA_ORIENTATION=-
MGFAANEHRSMPQIKDLCIILKWKLGEETLTTSVDNEGGQTNKAALEKRPEAKYLELKSKNTSLSRKTNTTCRAITQRNNLSEEG